MANNVLELCCDCGNIVPNEDTDGNVSLADICWCDLETDSKQETKGNGTMIKIATLATVLLFAGVANATESTLTNEVIAPTVVAQAAPAPSGEACTNGAAKFARGAETMAAGAKALQECLAKSTGPRGKAGPAGPAGESVVGPVGPMGQQGEPGPRGADGVTQVVHVHHYDLSKPEPSAFNLGLGYFISGFGSEDNRDYGAGHGPMIQLSWRVHPRVEGVVDIGLPTLFNRKTWSPWKEKGFVVNLATTIYTKKRPWLGFTPVGVQFQGIGFENDSVTGQPKADGLYMMYAPGVAVKLPRKYVTYRFTATALAGVANFGNDWNSVFGGGANVSFTPNWNDLLGE